MSDISKEELKKEIAGNILKLMHLFTIISHNNVLEKHEFLLLCLQFVFLQQHHSNGYYKNKTPI